MAKNDVQVTPDFKNPSYRDGVNRRPGMWVSIRNGVNDLVHYVFNYFIEAERNLFSEMHVTVSDSSTFSIENNGPGIPTYIYDSDHRNPFKGMGKTFLELLMTEGYYFFNTDTFYFGYFNGSIRTVNAFSLESSVETRRDGFLWRQTYTNGIPDAAPDKVRLLEAKGPAGTIIRFTLNPDHCVITQAEVDLLTERLRWIACTFLDVQTRITDHREKRQFDTRTFLYSGGAGDYIAALRGRKPLHSVITSQGMFDTKHQHPPYIPRKYVIDVAFGYSDRTASNIVTLINAENTTANPYRLNFLLMAFYEVLREIVIQYTRQHGMEEIVPALLTEGDLKKGLVAVMSVWHPDAWIEEEIIFSNLKKLVENAFSEFAEHEPEAMRNVIEHILRQRNKRLGRTGKSAR